MSSLQESIESLAERFNLEAAQVSPIIKSRANTTLDNSHGENISFSFYSNGMFLVRGKSNGKHVKASYVFEDDGDFMSLDGFSASVSARHHC